MHGLCVYIEKDENSKEMTLILQEALQKNGIETNIEELFDYLDIRWISRINKPFWKSIFKLFSLFTLSKSKGSIQSFISFTQKHCWRQLEANLENFNPDFIITTHHYASSVLAELLATRNISIPVYYFSPAILELPNFDFSNKIKSLLVCGNLVEKNIDTTVLSFPKDISIPIITQAESEAGSLNILIEITENESKAISFFEDIIKLHHNIKIAVSGTKEITVKLKAKADKNNIKLKIYESDTPVEYQSYNLIACLPTIENIMKAIALQKPFVSISQNQNKSVLFSILKKKSIVLDYSSERKNTLNTIMQWADNHEPLDEIKEQINMLKIKFDTKSLADFIKTDIEKKISK